MVALPLNDILGRRPQFSPSGGVTSSSQEKGTGALGLGPLIHLLRASGNAVA